MSIPCYSARFIQPFAQVLSTYESFSRDALQQLRAIDPAGRIPIGLANDLSVRQVSAVDDPDLGLKAAQVTSSGVAGALEYAINSAPTMRDALDVGARFARLFSDALRIPVEVDRLRVKVRLESSVPAPRTIPDYAMATWYAKHVQAVVAGGARLDCYFEHPRPKKTLEYESVFGRATLHFDAPYYGFAFDREYFEAPLPASDSALHIVLCDHVSRAVSQLHDRPSMVDRVRQIALRELVHGKATVARAAGALHMSTRTLASRLEREGTTYSALIDETKRELALKYLVDPELSLAEISCRLGFSHIEGFYRAFKRWTGEPPVAYRRKRAGTQ
jgi:AraC-like DNA-binding protein